MEILINWLKQGFKIVFVLLFIFTLSIFITVNSVWLYDFSIHWLNLSTKTNLSSFDLMRTYKSLVSYLQIPWQRHLNLIYFRSSLKGLIHFKDVKRLILVNNLILFLSGVWSFWYLRTLKVKRQLWALITPLKMVATFLLILLVTVAINFQAAFVVFHRLLFRNYDWIFNARSDPVILAFPNSYFLECFILVWVIWMFSIALIVVWAVHFDFHYS